MRFSIPPLSKKVAEAVGKEGWHVIMFGIISIQREHMN